METVFVLFESDYEGYYIHGIFTSRELAEKAEKESTSPWAVWVKEVPLNKLDNSYSFLGGN